MIRVTPPTWLHLHFISFSDSDVRAEGGGLSCRQEGGEEWRGCCRIVEMLLKYWIGAIIVVVVFNCCCYCWIVVMLLLNRWSCCGIIVFELFRCFGSYSFEFFFSKLLLLLWLSCGSSLLFPFALLQKQASDFFLIIYSLCFFYNFEC